MIKINLFGDLRELCCSQTMVLKKEFATLNDVLEELKKTHAELYNAIIKNGKLREFYIILVNGISIENLSGLNTELKDQDELSIFPPVAGG